MSGSGPKHSKHSVIIMAQCASAMHAHRLLKKQRSIHVLVTACMYSCQYCSCIQSQLLIRPAMIQLSTPHNACATLGRIHRILYWRSVAASQSLLERLHTRCSANDHVTCDISMHWRLQVVSVSLLSIRRTVAGISLCVVARCGVRHYGTIDNIARNRDWKRRGRARTLRITVTCAYSEPDSR